MQTSERDAIAVETLLRQKYGFKTILLLNANRYETLNAPSEFRQELTGKNNFLLYYSGQGELANDSGYWLPIDAEPDDDVNGISNRMVTNYIETMSAKHILVVADSAYSGTLTSASLSQLSTGLTSAQQRQFYELDAKSKVRTTFSSGGVKPIVDLSESSPHSIFAKSFIDELTANIAAVLSVYKLFQKVQSSVKSHALRFGVDQNPQYSALNYAGHERGVFLFVLPELLKRKR